MGHIAQQKEPLGRSDWPQRGGGAEFFREDRTDRSDL